MNAQTLWTRTTRLAVYVTLLYLLVMVGCRPADEAMTTTPDGTTPTVTAPTIAVAALPSGPGTPEAALPGATATETRASASLTPTVSASATPTASPTPTPDPYLGMSIAELAARRYGGGELDIIDTLEETDSYTRYLITYPSDGLTIYGFLSVPVEGVKFPVAIVAHGFIPPDEYQVEAYTTRYATALTEAGYLVIHPNFRNYPPSDTGPNPFRIGYATDILNLIAVIQEQSLDPHGYLRRADGENIHLMGHSMGGGAVLRAAVVRPEAVSAVVLYGSMSGDEVKNHEQILVWTGGARGHFELAAPAEVLEAVSPIHHLDRLQAPVSIHHSLEDETVPVAWSEELCGLLTEMGHPVECFTYEGVPHTFRGHADSLFISRMIAFFDRN